MVRFFKRKEKPDTTTFDQILVGECFYRQRTIWLKVSFDAAFDFTTSELIQLNTDAEVRAVAATIKWSFAQ